MKPILVSIRNLLCFSSEVDHKRRRTDSNHFLNSRNNNNSGYYIIIFYVLLILLLSLSQVINSYAQPRGEGLQPGDSVPGVILPRLINYKSPNVRLSDLRGKLVLIDFWATWCTACIANFPKVDSLQTQFKGQLQVLMVTREGEKKVLPFLERYNQRRASPFALPMVLNDTTLNTLFPHRYIPHYVWIGPDGVVKAITGSEKVTAANISAILQGTSKNLAVKKDLDPLKPLFLTDAVPPASLMQYSILMKGRYAGLSSGNHRLNTETAAGIAVTNSSLLWLYETVAVNLFQQMNETFTDRRIIIQNPQALSSSHADSLYTYQLLLPAKSEPQLYHYMLEDLNRYLPYRGRIDKLKVSCLVLRRRGTKDLLRSKGGTPQNKLYDPNDARLQNSSLAGLVVRLNSFNKLRLPVIDETGYTGMADLRIHASFDDLRALRKNLQEYGLDLRPATRRLSMLVISARTAAPDLPSK